MPKIKCLIIDPIHPSIFDLLKNENIDLEYKPDILIFCITKENVKDLNNMFEME